MKSDSSRTEIVRSVSIVLHLANGQDEVYVSTDQVTVVPAEELPDLIPEDQVPNSDETLMEEV